MLDRGEGPGSEKWQVLFEWPLNALIESLSSIEFSFHSFVAIDRKFNIQMKVKNTKLS